MNCPYCGSTNLKVLDSRGIDETNSIRRRRECGDCAKKFTTVESIEAKNLLVLKKNGAVELFDKNKLHRGIIKACEKRPISLDQTGQIVENIEKTLFNEPNATVDSRLIGNAVMNELMKLDQVAYVRYAAVYKDFSDLETLYKDIGDIIIEKSNKNAK